MGKHAKQQSAEQMREYRLRREQEEREKQRKQNRIILWTLVGIAAVALIGVIIGIVVTQLGKESDPFSETIVPEVDQMDPSQFTETDQTTEYVKLTVTYTDENGDAQQGDIIVRLRTDIAPITVKNFQKLVGEHFYDGLTFHRVYSGFMIQGGDPDGDGSGGSDETIKGEFLSNGVTNNLTHVRGVLSMARSTSYNSASSQFFIVHEDSPHLDGNYAAFGYVVSGMSTVDGIAGTEVESNSSGEKSVPVNPVTIVKAVFVELSDGETQADTSLTEPIIPEVDQMDASQFAETDQTTEYVKLTVSYTDENSAARQGDIIVRLRADIAPITVKNFQKLVGEHFYDGLTFHRVYSGFMIQGGDPDGDGSGGSDETIQGEFSSNGVANRLSHVRGVLSMARRGNDSNSASSQFFIVHEDSDFLDGDYAAFGYVVSGMSTVDGIAGTEVKSNSAGEKSSPVNPVTIVKAVFVENTAG